LGTDKLLRQAQKFYLAKSLNFALPTAAGSLPAKTVDKLELAWTAVGQGKTLVTPLQMAMVAAAIANNGEVKQPFIVKEVKSYTGVTLKKSYPVSLGQAVSANTAKLITEAMIKVVKQGTGQAAQIKGVTVAGKTGSAEVAAGLKPHAWFVGFAPAENPKVAVAVLLENAGLGGQVAAPRAKKVLAAALSLLN
jgi:peptidoglycan glycosyltransferase